jgi:hypothetical protein
MAIVGPRFNWTRAGELREFGSPAFGVCAHVGHVSRALRETAYAVSIAMYKFIAIMSQILGEQTREQN